MHVGLPGRMPATPIAVDFAANGTATTIDNDSTCTGTVANPTAPAGRICAYYNNSGGLDSLQANLPTWDPGDDGFVVGFNANGSSGSNMYLQGSWAYTTPNE